MSCTRALNQKACACAMASVVRAKYFTGRSSFLPGKRGMQLQSLALARQIRPPCTGIHCMIHRRGDSIGSSLPEDQQMEPWPCKDGNAPVHQVVTRLALKRPHIPKRTLARRFAPLHPRCETARAPYMSFSNITVSKIETT